MRTRVCRTWRVVAFRPGGHNYGGPATGIPPAPKRRAFSGPYEENRVPGSPRFPRGRLRSAPCRPVWMRRRTPPGRRRPATRRTSRPLPCGARCRRASVFPARSAAGWGASSDIRPSRAGGCRPAPAARSGSSGRMARRVMKPLRPCGFAVVREFRPSGQHRIRTCDLYGVNVAL
jgi:hypothetical protein